MEAKYTPGPWFAVDYAGKFDIQNGDGYEDTDLLCYDTIWNEKSLDKETVEANAKLMAAAPEMLEALNMLLEELDKLIDHVVDMGCIDFEDESIEGVRDINNAKKLAIDVIKKATQ